MKQFIPSAGVVWSASWVNRNLLDKCLELFIAGFVKLSCDGFVRGCAGCAEDFGQCLERMRVFALGHDDLILGDLTKIGKWLRFC